MTYNNNWTDELKKTYLEEQSRWKEKLSDEGQRKVRMVKTTPVKGIGARKPIEAKTKKGLATAMDRRKDQIVKDNPNIRGHGGRPNLEDMSVAELANHHSDHFSRDNEYGGSLPGELDHVENHIKHHYGAKVLDKIRQKSDSELAYDQAFSKEDGDRAIEDHKDAISGLRDLGHEVDSTIG
jgi:hypothetical protein